MTSDQRPPYFTQPELLNELTKALGLKSQMLGLRSDYLCRDHDHRLRENVFSSIIEQLNISSPFGIKMWTAITQFGIQFFDTYIEYVKKIPLDAMTREQAANVMVERIFPFFTTELFLLINQLIPTYSPMYFIGAETAIDRAFDWVENHINGWSDFWISLDDKEVKDMVQRWRKGLDIPSFKKINSFDDLDTNLCIDAASWEVIKSLLSISRAVDYFRKSFNSWIENTRQVLWSGNTSFDVGLTLSTINYQYSKPLSKVCSTGLELLTKLSRYNNKTDLYPERIYFQIEEFEKLASKQNVMQQCAYMVNLLKARWHVFMGKIDKSLSFYELAFDQVLYRAGGNQLDVINEALVCAAYCDDRSFLKQLKEQGIVFGLYEKPYKQTSSASLNRQSRSKSQVMQDWEVNQIKSHFFNLFPRECFFEGVTPPNTNGEIGPLFVDLSSPFEPDYNKPNRKVKPDKTKYISYPQIVWFAMNKDKEVVKRLLDAGARVDSSSHSGDTAILMAIQELNPQSFDATFDDSLFNLLIGYTHKPETLNTLTAKRRLSPMLCAIETGRLDVVSKLITAGTDVNLRAGLDDMTPLYACINLIGLVKKLGDSASMTTLLENRVFSRNTAEAFRRYSNGLLGFNTEQNFHAMSNQSEDISSNELNSVVLEILAERIAKYNSLKELRKIAFTLIENGADISAVHDIDDERYNPMMLAIETDEPEIVTRMLADSHEDEFVYEGEVLSLRAFALKLQAHQVLSELQKT